MISSEKTVQVLSLPELYKANSNPLQILSDYCTNELKKKGRFSSNEGAMPKLENYQKWNKIPEGILIACDSYQVAPYAVGFVKITVPYSGLKLILATDSPWDKW